MDYLKWYQRWNDTRSFIIENDCLKKKRYFYTSFPKTNKYGFQDGDIRRIIISDILSRFNRINDYNVLFPVGFNSLSNSSYLENKKISNSINDDISKMFYKEMQMLGISINDSMCIDMRHNEYLANLQQMFIDLYNRGYIEYKPISVYYDKKNNKIYDTKLYDLDLPQQIMKCFVLNINNLVYQIVGDIKNLRCSLDLKNRLIGFFKPEVSLKVLLSLSNEKMLEVLLNEPEYLGGASFIFLNPDKMDVRDYIDPVEEDSVDTYINGTNNNLFCYTGVQAINPLTGKKIPLFISRMFSIDIYIGIPSIDEDAMSIALNSGFVYDEIIEDGLLINSDFLDGYSINDAHNKIIDAFIEYEMGEKSFNYKHTEINLSSIDNFGPLFPFLVDKSTEKINSLEGHLPYTFSSKLRPTLEEDVDIIGNTLNGTINRFFIDGVTPFLCAIHDDLGAVESLFEKRSIDELTKWLPIEYIPVLENNVDSEIVMPIVINNILRKENGYSFPLIFKRIEEVEETLDIVDRKLERANNNLFSIGNICKNYQPDTIRMLAVLSGLSDHLIIDYDKLDEIENTLNTFKANCSNLLDGKNDLDYKVLSLHSRCSNLLINCDVVSYANEVYKFLKTYGINNDLTINQAKIIIKICYPLMPFLAEELNLEKLNSKYLLANLDWNDEN